MAVIILSSHTHSIVFCLAMVDGGQQLCEIVCKVCHPESDKQIYALLWSFSPDYANAFPLVILLPIPALLIILWRFANSQTLFCLSVGTGFDSKIPSVFATSR